MLLRKDLRRAVQPSWVTLFRSYGLGLTPRTTFRLTRFNVGSVRPKARLRLGLGPVGGSIARVTDAVCTRYIFLANRLCVVCVLVGFNTITVPLEPDLLRWTSVAPEEPLGMWGPPILQEETAQGRPDQRAPSQNGSSTVCIHHTRGRVAEVPTHAGETELKPYPPS